jgi:hypothetical protein
MAGDEAFRQYGIIWGLPRVARTFGAMGMPLTWQSMRSFPNAKPKPGRRCAALVPHAPAIVHEINNSTALLPLVEGPAAQRAYIRQTIDRIEKSTGIRTIGWSSPSVYPNADTFEATAAEGIRYSLGGMDSDILSRLGTSPPLLLVPYPPTVADMGQYLSRTKEAADLERLWTDYIDELD